ncbi:hypothetical protein V8F44DRAFT_641252, partial [Aspergillus fumigatus]
PSNISKITLSVDGSSICGIQLVDHNSSTRSDGPPWYEILDARNADFEARVSCNVCLPVISRGAAT